MEINSFAYIFDASQGAQFPNDCVQEPSLFLMLTSCCQGDVIQVVPIEREGEFEVHALKDGQLISGGPHNHTVYNPKQVFLLKWKRMEGRTTMNTQP